MEISVRLSVQRPFCFDMHYDGNQCQAVCPETSLFWHAWWWKSVSGCLSRDQSVLTCMMMEISVRLSVQRPVCFDMHYDGNQCQAVCPETSLFWHAWWWKSVSLILSGCLSRDQSVLTCIMMEISIRLSIQRPVCFDMHGDGNQCQAVCPEISLFWHAWRWKSVSGCLSRDQSVLTCLVMEISITDTIRLSVQRPVCFDMHDNGNQCQAVYPETILFWHAWWWKSMSGCLSRDQSVLTCLVMEIGVRLSI